jgi:U3 small nucleolar RNA-associated protein 20
MLLYATHCVCVAPGGEAEAELLPPAARLDGTAPLACNVGIEQAREARLWCMKLLAQMLQAFPAPSHFAPYLPLLFGAAAPVMHRMHTHYTQSPAGLLVTVLAMAQQPATLPLLLDAPTELLPCVIRCISARKCAPSVLDATLSLVEALLDQLPRATAPRAGHPSLQYNAAHAAAAADAAAADADAPAEPTSAPQAAASELLHAHMDTLLSQLLQRIRAKFGGDATKALTATAMVGDQATRELRLLTRLSGFVTSAEQAEQLMELLLPYLRLKPSAKSERVKEHVLQLARGLLRSVRNPAAHLTLFSQLFAGLRGRDARTAHCAAFEELASLEAVQACDGLKELPAVARVLSALNAYSTTELEERDYDARLEAYAMLPELLPRLTPQLGLPLLCQCIFDVELDDIALRASSSHAIITLVKHAAQCAPPPPPPPAAAAVGAAAAAAAAAPEKDGWAQLMATTLMPALKRALRLPVEMDSMRQQFIKLLGASLVLMPSLSPELATLANPREPEADFYLNLTHIQLPRRQRALARLRVRVEEDSFGVPTLTHWLLPMLNHLVVRSPPKEMDVAEEAVHTLRAVAARLPWRAYLAALLGLTRLLRLQPSLEKRLVRAMVAVLDVFHFDISQEEVRPAYIPRGRGTGVCFNCGEAGHEAYECSRPKLSLGATALRRAAATGLSGERPEKALSVGASGAKAAEQEGEEGEEGEEGDDEEEEEVVVAETAAEITAAAVAAAAAAAAGVAEAAVDSEVALAAVIRNTVRGKLLPQLYAHLKDPKSENLRVPVAMAVLKLLLQLPPSVLERELRGLIMRLAGAMKSRDKALRAVGRETLAKVAVELGAEHFGTIISELKSSLTRGFELHVLGHTVHHLLAALAPSVRPGDLDGAVPLLVSVLLEDIFGEPAEKREVEAIANSMKEAKGTQSFRSFELLGATLGFVPNINLVVPPLHACVVNVRVSGVDGSEDVGADSLKNIGNAREVLRTLSAGLGGNPSVALPPLCVYVCGMLSTHLPKEEGGGPSGSGTGEGAKAAPRRPAPAGTVLQPKVEAGLVSGATDSPLSRELVGFALELLLAAVRRGRFDAHNAAHVSLLEPLLPLLQRAMRSDADGVVSLALRTLSALVPFQLPSLPLHAAALLEHTMALLRRAADFAATSEVVGICLKVIAALLREARTQKRPAVAAAKPDGADGAAADAHEDFELGAEIEEARVGGGAKMSEAQLRWLVSFLSVHLEDVTVQNALFALLRVIFARRFVLPELYDLVGLLGEMVLQADAPSVRRSCSQLYLSFLLTYPLGPRRLQQHLNFFVTNLAYPVAHGRLSLLELVHDAIRRLPLDILRKQAELLLLPLTTRLVNDADQGCRVAVGRAVKRLLQRTCVVAEGGDAESAKAREKLLVLLHAWGGDGAPSALGRAAAQVAGLAVEALGRGATSLAPKLVPLLMRACAADAAAAADADADAERWQAAYYSLKAFEKLATLQPALLTRAVSEPLWCALPVLLLHDHSWVRTAAGRLLGLLFAETKPADLCAPAAASTAAGGEEPKKERFLRRRGTLLRLGDALLEQLQSAAIPEAASVQALKNLLWISAAMLRHPALAPPACERMMPTAKLPDDEACAAAAAEPSLWAACAVSSRLAPLVQSAGHVRGCAAMRWIAALATQLDEEQVRLMLPVCLPVVVRAAEDQSGKVHAQVKELGVEVLAIWQKVAAPPDFAAAYARFKEAQKAARRERKRKQAVEAVADPELTAVKRLAKNAGKQAQKKRKMVQVKRARDSSGSLGLNKKSRMR